MTKKVFRWLCASAVLFELYAVALAWLAYRSGVHTDEAKYLLNIPYPHPPVLRTMLGWLDGWSNQEVFVRFVFASLLIQAVWFIWDLTRDRTRAERLVIAMAYLLSATVISQAGTVMFATITAVQLLIWYWISARVHPRNAGGMLALFWLLTVMTTFQGILLTPLAWQSIRRQTRSFWLTVLATLLPIGLLGLYALSNPFALAAFVSHTDSSTGIWSVLLQTGKLWLIGGGLFLSMLGTAALTMTRHRGLQMTAALVLLYVLLAPQPHYALLFTMLFFVALTAYQFHGTYLTPACALSICAGLMLLGSWPLLPRPTVARQAVEALQRERVIPTDKLLLITGAFGHEWQYESPWPVAKYDEKLLPQAGAVVCLTQPCTVPGNIPVYEEN